ncbi:MAG TPA: helix-turn-helix transcriptional regulator [Pontiella sp.]|nr:helix-turn-helix transcriptional regulator [Pontiella sp.]
MSAGRPAQSKRSPFGERLFQLRERKGLSQQQAAKLLGVTQQSYATWERRPTALKPEQLVNLAQVFECSVDELVDFTAGTKRRGGPQGRARQTFEEVSKLPRSRQKKILDVVDALIKA